MQDQITLPAEVYDALKASAEKYGGIGAGWYSDPDVDQRTEDDPTIPFCVIGHATQCNFGLETRLAGLREGANDLAVARINARKCAPLEARVSWDEYVAELNIVRGE